MKYILSFCLLVTLASLAIASELYPGLTTEQADNFDDLIKSMRCTVCQNQSLYDSYVPTAMNMKRDIYLELKSGKSKEEIQQKMFDLHGEHISFTPKISKVTFLLWLSPLICTTIGILCARKYWVA